MNQQKQHGGEPEIAAEANKVSGKHNSTRAALLAFGIVVIVGILSFLMYRYSIEHSRPTTESLKKLAEDAESNGNTPLALSLRKQFLDKSPSDPTARILYAAAVARAGQFDTAATELGKLGKQPEIGALILEEANKFYDKSDFIVASFLYSRYINNFDSTNISVRIDCGYALFQSGRRDEGKKMTLSVLEIAPNQALAQFNLGVIAAEEQNMAESRAWFEKCAASAEQQYPEIAAKAREILTRLPK